MLDARRLPFECFYPWSTFVNPPLTVTAPIYLEGIHSPFSFGFSAAVCPLCTSSSTPNLIRPSSLSFHFHPIIVTIIINFCENFCKIVRGGRVLIVFVLILSILNSVNSTRSGKKKGMNLVDASILSNFIYIDIVRKLIGREFRCS